MLGEALRETVAPIGNSITGSYPIANCYKIASSSLLDALLLRFRRAFDHFMQVYLPLFRCQFPDDSFASQL